MSEVSRKTTMPSSSSSMAIVPDKRSPNRPGGCVGILFQLFDWNQRFAKKKLFPKKLLPPVRAAKKVSKKFGADEKMPIAKFLLIADENHGGFPNTKKTKETGNTPSSYNVTPETRTCAPSLVARLMGLEFMPSLPQDKPRKTVDSAFCCDASETSGSSSRHDLDLDLGLRRQGKLEPRGPRPQKLQKTGLFERGPVAGKLGSEALLLNRRVLSRSRKQQHKLASPVKSPRLLSRKNSARIMEAATKILEPNIQRRNRSRCALTYMDSPLCNAQKLDPSSSKKFSESGGMYPNFCQNCGSLAPAYSKQALESPSIVDYSYTTPHGAIPQSNATRSQSDLVRPASDSIRSSDGTYNACKMRAQVCMSNSRQPSLGIPAKVNASQIRFRTHDPLERKPHSRNGLEQCRPKEDAAPRSIHRQSYLRQNQAPLVKNKVSASPKHCSMPQTRKCLSSLSGSKDFVALNRNLNTSARPRTSITSPNILKIESQSSTLGRKEPVHKRRPKSVSQIGSVNPRKSILSQPKNTRNDKIHMKQAGSVITHPLDNNVTDPRKPIEDNCKNSEKNSEIVSFIFNAPFRNDSSSISSVKDSGDQRHQTKYTPPNPSEPEATIAANSGCSSFISKRILALKGDELSALLDEKITELNSLDDTSLSDGTQTTRSAASILEELISALMKGDPVPQREEATSTDECRPTNDQSFEGPSSSDGGIDRWYMLNKCQEETDSEASLGIFMGGECDQPSPVSILETSFSTDSCISESLNGQQAHLGFKCSSQNKIHSWDLDADVSDSAISAGTRRLENNACSSLSNGITAIPKSFPSDAGVRGSKSIFSTEVISNTSMLLGTVLSDEIESTVDFLLHDTLDALLDFFWTNPKCSLFFPEVMNLAQFRRFLFDCMIEHLDSTYSHYCKSGYKSWEKLRLSVGNDWLMQDIYADICKWRAFSGDILDDIVEKEMSQLSGKSLEFESEAFETGMEIQDDLLQGLVYETVIDFIQC